MSGFRDWHVGGVVIARHAGGGDLHVDPHDNDGPTGLGGDGAARHTHDGATDANVAVFDILGRRVSTVFRGRLKAGTTELAWNGRHDDGSRATAGVYFYRLEMKGRVVSRRLVLLQSQ